MAATILARLRTMPGSLSSRSMSVLGKGGNSLGPEAGEGSPKVLSLAENRDPGQS